MRPRRQLGPPAACPARRALLWASGPPSPSVGVQQPPEQRIVRHTHRQRLAVLRHAVQRYRQAPSLGRQQPGRQLCRQAAQRAVACVCGVPCRLGLVLLP